MEKIIFFALAIPMLAFVIYLGGSAIMKGFSAKVSKKNNDNLENNNHSESIQESSNLTRELNQLNKLLKDGVLTEEEFEKAKKKIFYN